VTNDFSIVYDPDNEKYVCFFRDVNYGDYGNVMVGTPNGTSITWGAKQLFDTTSVNPSQINAIYDTTNNKIVVCYRDNSSDNGATVTVCSLSGTTLTIGTPSRGASQMDHIEMSSFCYCPDTDNYAIIFNDGAQNKGWCKIGKYSGTNSSSWPQNKVEFYGSQARGTGCFYDTTANKLCVMAHKNADSNHGWIWAVTISNDTPTFGTGQEFIASNADLSRLTGAHDPTTGKSILSYATSEMTPFRGACRTATLSGTTFTFGTEVEYELGATYQSVIAYGSGPSKFLISYVDGSDSYKVKTQVVSISGSDVVIDGTPYTFQTNQDGQTAAAWIVYNPDLNNFATVYRNNDAGVYKMAYYVEGIRISNVTLGNYVGIANASYTNGQTASIALPGAVNTAVSGVAVGLKYYVLGDGSLNATADSVNIFAGQGIGANKLLVR